MERFINVLEIRREAEKLPSLFSYVDNKRFFAVLFDVISLETNISM